MKTFYSPVHTGHAPPQEFEGGKFAPAVEVPERTLRVKAEIERRTLGPILPPRDFGAAPIARVHDAGLVTFLGEHMTVRRWMAAIVIAFGAILLQMG